MTDSDSQSLDEVIAIYLDAVDSGRPANPEDFVAQWPQYRSEFLQFVAQNNTLDQLIGGAGDLAATPVSLPASERDIESFTPGYRIGRLIGRGGMGTVYEAVRISDNERVAIKVLNERTSLDAQHRQRFDRESQAIESLDHPHIVPLYSVSSSKDIQYLIMKLINGVTLSDLVAQPSDFRLGTAGCLEAAQRRDDYFAAVGRLIADVAGALETAHQSNIIHRDIKPSNLLLDTQGKVWLTDFGLASIGEGHATLTATGDILGTPAYMSPEQAMGDHREVDHRSDIYSLGATLYALAARRRPYVGTSIQILREVSEGLLTPPSRFRHDIPRDLEAIILKAMSRNPAKRYQSAAELEHDLRRFVGGRSVRAKVPGFIDHAFQWTLRNPRLTIAGVTSLLATIMSVIVIQWVVAHRLTGLNEKLSSSNQRLSESNEDLVISQRTLERNIYDADMSAAYRAHAQGDVDRMRELLARYGPHGDHAELAGFEWWLLDELSRPVEVRRIKGHAAAAHDVVILPGSTEYVTVGDDGLIRHGDLDSDEPLSEILVDGQLAAIAVSPDQSAYVIGQNVVDGINPVTLRDIKTGRVLQQLTGHEYSVESVAFSPCGQLIATAGRYQDVLIHSIDGKLLHRLMTESRNESLAFSPDGQHLLAVLRQEGPAKIQLIRAWDLKSMQPVFDISTDFRAMTFALSESSRELVVADNDHVAKMTFPGGATITSQDNLRGRVRNVAISPNGERHAAGCDNGLIYLWGSVDDDFKKSSDAPETATVRQAARPIVIDTGVHGITNLEFAKNGELVATNSHGEILVCAPPQRNPRVRHPGYFSRLIPGRSDPNRFLARCIDGSVIRFDALVHESPQLTTSDAVVVLNEPLDQYSTVAVSSNETCVAVGTPLDLVVADAETGDILTRIAFPEQNKVVRDLLFSSNGDSLLALFNDRLIAYRTSDWTMSKEVRLPNENAGRIGLSADGSSVFVVSESALLVYGMNGFDLRQSLFANNVTFSATASSLSGQFLAIGSSDGTTQLVNAGTLTPIAVFRGHRTRIQCVEFFNNDRSLVTADGNGVLRLWDVSSQRELGVLHTAGPNCAIVEEKQALVTWGTDRPLRVWSAGKFPQ